MDVLEPAKVTKVGRPVSKSMPSLTAMQLSTLARLAALQLQMGKWAADGYTVLTRLTGMTRLQLCHNEFWPASLGQLSGLEALVRVGQG